jgi:hypothetical protein
MHPHRTDDRGSVRCKTPVAGNHGCLTHRQEHGTRQLPLWRVVVSSCCLRLASAPPWDERPPEISKSRNLEISKSRNLEISKISKISKPPFQQQHH